MAITKRAKWLAVILALLVVIASGVGLYAKADKQSDDIKMIAPEDTLQ